MKRPGEQPTADQQSFLVAVQQAGGLGYWVTSVEGATALIVP